MTVINRPKSLIEKLKTGIMPPLQLVAILVAAHIITLAGAIHRPFPMNDFAVFGTSQRCLSRQIQRS